MVKLLENTFRAVNIGLVNEMALICRALGVDVWEVIEAAKTKPFGFMAFYPGPGLGGHCIAVDPFYLNWKARKSGLESRFIELAGAVNAGMPRQVVERVNEALNSRSRAVRGSRVHLFGMAYKANVSDTRESPAISVAALLQQRGATVSYSDPFVPAVCEGALALKAVPAEEALADGMDCAVIVTDHGGVDYAEIARRAPVVVDTRKRAARNRWRTHLPMVVRTRRAETAWARIRCRAHRGAGSWGGRGAMPGGPGGERRPADLIADAVRVARAATGDADEISCPRWVHGLRR